MVYLKIPLIKERSGSLFFARSSFQVVNYKKMFERTNKIEVVRNYNKYQEEKSKITNQVL